MAGRNVVAGQQLAADRARVRLEDRGSGFGKVSVDGHVAAEARSRLPHVGSDEVVVGAVGGARGQEAGLAVAPAARRDRARRVSYRFCCRSTLRTPIRTSSPSGFGRRSQPRRGRRLAGVVVPCPQEPVAIAGGFGLRVAAAPPDRGHSGRGGNAQPAGIRPRQSRRGRRIAAGFQPALDAAVASGRTRIVLKTPTFRGNRAPG